MCKKKDKKMPELDKKLKYTHVVITICETLIIVLWILWLFSLVSELQTQHGIINCEFKKWLTPLVNADSVFETAQAIGISSALIAWTYEQLGNHELGIKYIDLLELFCKHYHAIAFGHIIAVLASIWLAKVHILESALLALCIVALGLIIQTLVLVFLIFDATVRKKLAHHKWELRTSIQNGDTKKLESEIYALVDNIPITDGLSCASQCHLLAKILIEQVQMNIQDCSRDNLCKILVSTSHIWQRLLENRSTNERSLITKHIFSYISQSCKDSGTSISICSSYVIWLCEKLIQDPKIRHAKATLALSQLWGELLQIIQHTGGITERVGKEFSTLYQVLLWTHFLCGDLNLSVDLFTCCNKPTGMSDSDKKYYEPIICHFFDEHSCDSYFNIAWKQVCPNITMQVSI